MKPWQVRWLEGKMPKDVHALLKRVPDVKDGNEAYQLMLEIGVVHQRESGYSAAEAFEEARLDVAYYSGYSTTDDRDRIERVFGVEHPVFGSVAKNGPADLVAAFAAGAAIHDELRNRKRN